MEDKYQNKAISQWAEDDRPREKILNKGVAAVSDAELIAILLRSGYKQKSALHLAQELLQNNENDLIRISQLDVKDLTKYKGMGTTKAISIIAALELGRRRRFSEVKLKKTINSSKTAYELIYPVLTDKTSEEFWMICLNRANQLIERICISEGGFSGTVADPKKIFKKALENYSSGIILFHNHPSGNLKPSRQDIVLTEKLVKAGKILEINVLDHIILGMEDYYSFADNGLI
jgi:DNA repair protein RadC